jgi:nucleoside phosphorylase
MVYTLGALFESIISSKPTSPSKDYYSFLVVSALHEEMEPFLKGKNHTYIGNESELKKYGVQNSKGTVFNVLCYSSNKMGMPFNGVAITRIIERYSPRYVLFIGTCAGLRRTKYLKEGDVLIPEYIYAYDSGKHDDKGVFQIEHRHYEVSSSLRTLANDMISEKKYLFNIKQSCGFCSGSSVVNSKDMIEKIENEANRKVSGFDMEAYVIAVINQLYKEVETIVIKGIMDFGINKKDTYKQVAKENSAKVADDLIRYIIDHGKIVIGGGTS